MHVILAAAVATYAVLAAMPAVAAPQILGLVASTGPIPLACDDAGCRAELSSFCLPQPRANPAPDTAYQPAAVGGIFLVGTDLVRPPARIAAAPYLRFPRPRALHPLTPPI